ncbi:mechanosensitive ion channel [Erythrobacter sp. SCSIO 43205]|uniref:mechanosensitive ion channel family protein n=1 Tax=Erythrobacter sp. SCSIO 43205 TaxID=2779361 RepID=UPI001CA9E022|nr:mechanosensitive ion channel domain-containing protein [Erythrobacter sp. SCSIO 43205]UAB79179.1 mechanosensitive ion channel [Erythrobacter sp. SCSIO 43205]
MTANAPDITEVTDAVQEAGSGEEPANADAESADATGEEGASSTTEASEAAQEEVVKVAEGAKEELSATSDTLGSLIDTLDSWAFVLGDVRISVFDVVFLLATIGLVITAAWFVTKLARNLIGRVKAFDGSQQLLAEKLATIAIWTVAFFVTIDLIGIDLTALAVFGGAFGLAIGFGLQKTFGNLISGILLLLDKSIKPGDVISVTDQAGQEAVGQIRKIGIRAISVITRDQTEYLIPNELLMTNQVVNWSYSSRDVRVRAPVGVSYDSDLDLVTDLLYQAVDETDRILATPRPRVNLMGFGDSSVDFEIRFWIKDPESGLANIRSDVYMRLWQLFKENNIEIPFPQRDLHLRSSKQLDHLVELVSSGKVSTD